MFYCLGYVINVVVRGTSVPMLASCEYGGDYNSLRSLEVEEDRAQSSLGEIEE